MKKYQHLLLLSIILVTSSCSDDNSSANIEKTPNKAEKKITKKEIKAPTPKTITKQEVSRIALVEAKQLMKKIENINGINVNEIHDLYKQAQKSYDNGEFIKAQMLAVKVRRSIEKIPRR